MTYPRRALAGLVLFLMLGLACNLSSTFSSTPPAAATLSQLYTAAARTVQAASTNVAAATPSTSPTNPFPTFSLTLPSATIAAITPCNAAAFVRDVTITDGTILDAGEDFTKTWRIQNVGTCSWTTDYSMVFASGDRMHAPGSVALSGNVSPGHSVDLSVDMTAPSADGSYQGYWKLRTGAGVLFGIGGQAQGPFWVKIKVAGPTYTAYDFVAHYCDASWQNNKSDLPCPGAEGSSQGYVIALNHPTLENGAKSDDPGLLTVPRATSNGLITGTYPAVKIRDGDRFQTLVNCAYKAYACNVSFQLEYQVGGGSVHTLATWNEAYEGRYFPVNLDLDELAGQNVKFTLTVSVNGAFDQDQAIWVAPRITRVGSPPPTPTSTATFTASPTATFTAGPTVTLTSTSTATFTPSPTSTVTPTATP